MSIAKLFSRRFLAGAVAIPVVTGGLVLITPGAAEAATCGQSWTNKDPGGGQAIYQSANGYTFPLRTGIYSDCRVTWWVSDGIPLKYDCYRMNSNYNTWTHLHVASDPTVSGWAWDQNLKDGGSVYPC